MRIDAHQHYWQLSRGDYDWLTPELGALYRDFMPDDLEPIIREQGIDKTIAVQAAPTTAETEFLLGLAEKHDSIAGVVGWLDLESVRFEAQFEAYRKHAKFVGVRIMLQDMEGAEWLHRPDVTSRLRWLADRDCPVDLLVREHQLPYVASLAEVVPHLRGVVDHIGKPDIAARSIDSWRVWLEKIAKNPNMYCKLSGMVTEADHASWKPDDLTEYVEHAVRVFGTERLIYGSDWPVCLLAASYAQVADVVERYLAGFPEADRDNIFGRNAARFYKLEV